jgi:membrane fusion protein (multidrug efflux system)
LSTLFLFAACRGGQEEKAVPAVVSVKTGTAEIRSFSVTVTALGTVDARPGSFAALGAPGPTRVAKIFVRSGERVNKGTPLIEFERAPFEAAAKGAESALVAAQNARERAARLVEAGIAPRKDLDQATAELAQAEANVVPARRALELATLKAPLTGVVTRMTAIVGAPVDATLPLVEVADPDALDVVFNLSPTDAGQVRTGQPVTITAGDRADGDALATGAVISVALAVDSATRSIAVRASLAHLTRALRMGETAFGRIEVATRPKAVTVPVEALVPEGEGYKVFVVNPEGLALSRNVTVGGRTEGLAEITEGLEGGETIVTYGAYGVADSAKIAPTIGPSEIVPPQP